MNTPNPPNPRATEPLLVFPCAFPIKAMGRTTDVFDPAGVEMRASSAGNYLSVTCTIMAASRQQLDDLYRDLSSHPAVAMVL
jgi:putative lipoic acid-binding regulatory protein